MTAAGPQPACDEPACDEPACDEPAWVGDVIRFWLAETPPEARFKTDPALDQAIRERFAALLERLTDRPPAARTMTPRSALAAIIVLDQFPRNMFRPTARAFATDRLARDIAHAAIAAGLDRQVAPADRLFVYLPLEHSEDLAEQEQAVALISALGDASFTRYAEAHRDIIQRFGRFPHRNAALGRPSTAAEAAFLLQPGSSF